MLDDARCLVLAARAQMGAGEVRHGAIARSSAPGVHDAVRCGSWLLVAQAAAAQCTGHRAQGTADSRPGLGSVRSQNA